MHEATRRAMCRLLFVILCLIPTLATSGWAWIRNTDAANATRCEAWARRIAAQMAIRTTSIGMQAVDYPTPGQTVFHRLRLADRTNQQELIRLPMLRVTQAGEEYRISAASGELIAERLQEFGTLLHDSFLAGVTHGKRLLIQRLTVHLASARDVDLNSVHWVANHGDGMSRGDLSFQTKDDGGRVRLRIQHDEGSDTVQLRLNTMNETLPCELLVPFLPSLASLGPDATFQGMITASWQDGQRNLLLAGRWEAIDLASLAAAMPGGYSASGQATFQGELHSYRGQVVSAGGVLLATAPLGSPSSAARYTLDSRWLRAGRRLGLSGGRQPLTLSTLVQFRRLAIRFQLKEGQVVLAPSESGEALLTDLEGNALWSLSHSLRLPLPQFIDATISESRESLMVSPRSAQLLRWFR